ncbi:MAG: hypothetical protein ACTHMG_00210 [Sphingomonas sp.]
MDVPERFSIIIEGRVTRVRERYVIDHGNAVGRYLALLLTGCAIPDEVWRPYGLRVTIEEDTDQAD